MSMAKLPVAELRIGNYIVCVKNRLAEGGFGYVDLVYDANSKVEYVLKRAGIERNEVYEVVKKEISILQRYAGPHLVKLLASEVIVLGKGKREACLLLELCPGGHLLDRISSREGKHLPPPSLYRIFGQLLLAVQPMHESNPPVTHRDLKLENILFGADGNVRLCDFGSCVMGHIFVRNVEEKAAAEEIIGKETTPMYRSPEMIDLYMRDILTEKTDIWDMGSLGILSAKIKFPEAPVAPEVQTLLMRMLDVDPEARPSITQLLQAFAAIATGKPLPLYVVPPEAIERRKEREITAKKREEKNKSALKKAAPKTLPVKASGPLDSNSVAARRLAMKKGGAIDMIGHHAAAPSYQTEGQGQAPSPSHSQSQSDSHSVNAVFTSTTDSTGNSFFANDFPAQSVGASGAASAPSSLTEIASFGSVGQKSSDHFPSSSSISFSDPWFTEDVGSRDSINGRKSSHQNVFDKTDPEPAPVTKSKPPPLPPKPQKQSFQPTSAVAPTASFVDWNDTDCEAKPSITSNRSSHETLVSLNAGGVPSDVFTMQSSTDSDMGFVNFASSPMTSRSPVPSFNNSASLSSSSFAASPTLFVGQSPPTSTAPATATVMAKGHQASSSVDFFGDSDVPSKPASRTPQTPVARPPVQSTRVTPPVPVPAPAARAKSVNTLLPSYELDLFDTTPGPPVIDFLSLENAPASGGFKSTVVSRQQAADVLSLFDQDGEGGTNLMSPVPQRSCPDLTKTLTSSNNNSNNNNFPNGMKRHGTASPQMMMQQQQQQQVNMARPLSYPLPSQQRQTKESSTQRPTSALSSAGAQGTFTQKSTFGHE